MSEHNVKYKARIAAIAATVVAVILAMVTIVIRKKITSVTCEKEDD